MSPNIETTEKSPNTRKRPLATDNEFDIPELGGDFSDIFANLKADVTKTMSAKKKKYEIYSKTSSEYTRKKIDEVYAKQETDRSKLTQDFCLKIKKLNDEFQEDIKKATESEEQLLNVFKHYHKMTQQTRQRTSNTFKSIVSTAQDFKQKSTELSKKHQKEKEDLQTDIDNEIKNLQKKIISYSKQEGIANFKRSLESMLTLEENEI
ncbi:Synaptonemal complex protein 3-like isoform X3 [Oopsacas minuta]|uniref:Synaptonemal complex protein 3-like isoform X3 n=1 Tax=Oopsacas minuta TaxID=111878 RepID=A0AAV7KBL8_9METZ|nr:Synaptonemal complex protein 3-like isoform X3 [Oopsacas minuta]